MTKIEFRDPGMRPLVVDVEDVDSTLRTMTDYFTRAYVFCGGKLAVYVRALGRQEWHNWTMMSFGERYDWTLQDRE